MSSDITCRPDAPATEPIETNTGSSDGGNSALLIVMIISVAAVAIAGIAAVTILVLNNAKRKS